MTDEYTEERYLREILAELQESYSKAAKPYIDRLIAIECMKPMPPLIVTLEQANAMGIVVPNAMLSGTETEPTTKRDA